MSVEEREQRARATIEAYDAGDRARLEELYSPDIVWRVGGSHALAGVYRGRDELFAYFDKVSELTGGSLKLELEDVVVGDVYTTLFVRTTGQREGRELDVTLAEVLKEDADGRFVEFWALPNDQDAVNEFWA